METQEPFPTRSLYLKTKEYQFNIMGLIIYNFY